MRVVQNFPFRIREIENLWIPLPDGTRLAARAWMPESGPAPAIVEYIPYRKRWGTRTRDEPMHRYFAGHGYAAIRIDIRGSGESEGLLADEYTPKEQQDGVDALRWIAQQPWCDGNVGMIGKSWGGFAALQIAALQPPELKAIIAVCGSDDRYTDDAHYMGGCLLTENLIWGSVLFTLSALPPDPAEATNAVGSACDCSESAANCTPAIQPSVRISSVRRSAAGSVTCITSRRKTSTSAAVKRKSPASSSSNCACPRSRTTFSGGWLRLVRITCIVGGKCAIKKSSASWMAESVMT
jgi:predicted acyl esterase